MVLLFIWFFDHKYDLYRFMAVLFLVAATNLCENVYIYDFRWIIWYMIQFTSTYMVCTHLICYTFLDIVNVLLFMWIFFHIKRTIDTNRCGKFSLLWTFFLFCSFSHKIISYAQLNSMRSDAIITNLCNFFLPFLLLLLSLLLLLLELICVSYREREKKAPAIHNIISAFVGLIVHRF